MEGRENENLTEEGTDRSGEEPTTLGTLVRIADSLEKLASDPEVEIEAGPPLCPNCGKFDPEIVLPDQEAARGLMSQIVIDCSCGECGHRIYIIIESYSVHRSRVTVENEIKERERVGLWRDSRNTENASLNV